ncbi:MAG: cytochrome c3 family protein [Desulfobacterales bacterium]
MNTKKIFLIAFGVLCMAVLAIAEQNRGAEKIVLKAGNMGDVTLPHQQHQTALGDCKLCHDLFAQEAGIIDKMKAESKLKAKQVMNDQCIACHKEKKKEGVKTGPTSCSACHKK